MRKITFLFMSLFLLASTFVQAQSGRATILQSDNFVCRGGVMTLSIQNLEKDDHGFVWTVGDAKIAGGMGASSVQLSWENMGTKHVKLAYKKADGKIMTADCNVSVRRSPSFSNLTLPKTDYCEGEQLVLPTNPTIMYDEVGYTPVNGIGWTLNGSVYDKTMVINRYADGKILRYEIESSIPGCATIKSAGITLKVKERPLITGLTINNKEEMEYETPVNSNIVFKVAVSDPANVTSYSWRVGNEIFGDQNTATIKVESSNPFKYHNKDVTVDVTNACGTVSSQKIVYSGTSKELMTPANTSLKSTYATPLDFGAREVTATDRQTLPTKYWENKNYVFYTNNSAKYTHGGDAWFNRTSADQPWMESKTGVGYKFEVIVMKISPMMFTETNAYQSICDNQYGGDHVNYMSHRRNYFVKHTENTTTLLDEGEYLCLDDPTDFANSATSYNFGDTLLPLDNNVKPRQGNDESVSVGILHPNSESEFPLETRHNSKLFGLRNVVIKRLYEPTLPHNEAPFKILPRSGNNCVVENITLDASGYVSANHGVVSEKGLSPYNFTDGYHIVKDITIKNVEIEAKSPSNSPKGLFIVTSFNEKGTKNFYININVDESNKFGVSGSTSGRKVAGFYSYFSDNLYFKNINIGVTPTEKSEYSVLLGAETSGYTLGNNIVFDGIHNTNGKIDVDVPKTTNLAISGIKYSYISKGTDGKYKQNYYSDLPAYTDADSISVIYDKKDGYWIMYSEVEGISNPVGNQMKALKEFYEECNKASIPTPLPNIKLIANSNGQIEGFDIIDLETNEIVNIVPVLTANTVVSQNSNTCIPYVESADSNKIIRNLSSRPELVNIYNIDFLSEAEYSVVELVANSDIRLGNLFNCKLSDIVSGDFVFVSVAGGPNTTGIDNATAQAVVVYPNPIESELQINAPSAIVSVKVSDLNGRVVYSQNAGSANTATIEAGAWSQGVYVVSVQTAEKVYVTKIVKK